MIETESRGVLREVDIPLTPGSFTFNYVFPESYKSGIWIQMWSVFLIYTADATVLTRKLQVGVRSRSVSGGKFLEIYTSPTGVNASEVLRATFSPYVGPLSFASGGVTDVNVPFARYLSPGDTVRVFIENGVPTDVYQGVIRYLEWEGQPN